MTSPILGRVQFRVTQSVVVVIVIVIESVALARQAVEYDNDYRCADNDNEGWQKDTFARTILNQAHFSAQGFMPEIQSPRPTILLTMPTYSTMKSGKQ